MKQFRDRIAAALGPGGVLSGEEALEPFLNDARGRYRGATELVARPSTTEEVAAVVHICADEEVTIVPQGGNTGLVAGGIPMGPGRSVIVSLQRMDRIRNVDAVDHTITVEAGCILQDVQNAAREQGRLFPLSLAAEGSCRIGGNLSTNAGGIAVLHYGNARDLTLGIEVVLPDGRIWNGLRALRKDNSGYDLKHLFVGAEGTLGIITAATLKLFPLPVQVETAFVGVRDIDSVMELFSRARAATGDQLTAFELIPRNGMEFGLRHVHGTVDPFASIFPFYVLVEMSSSQPGSSVREAAEHMLAGAIDAGLVQDAVLAESVGQSRQLWGIREGVVVGHRFEGAAINHDVSVPVGRVARFVKDATAACQALDPDVRVIAFGHVGDGNIHFNLHQPIGADPAAFLARAPQFNRIVYDLATAMDGSISAEHGIGHIKKAELKRYRSEVELDLMRHVKRAIDPTNIMNPGKILD